MVPVIFCTCSVMSRAKRSTVSNVWSSTSRTCKPPQMLLLQSDSLAFEHHSSACREGRARAARLVVCLSCDGAPRQSPAAPRPCSRW